MSTIGKQKNECNMIYDDDMRYDAVHKKPLNIVTHTNIQLFLLRYINGPNIRLPPNVSNDLIQNEPQNTYTQPITRYPF